MKLRVLGLAALLLPLAGFAEAAPPQVQPWTSYDAGAEIRHLAMASSGTTISAALPPASANAGSTPGVPTSPVNRGDLAILDVGGGFARNGTIPSGQAAGEGRNLTAVGGQGRTVVSVGITSQVVFGTTPEQRMRIYADRANAVPWTPESTVTAFNRILDPGVPVKLVASADGSRVALAAQSGADMVVYGFTTGGSTFTDQFRFRTRGNVTDLAATSDLGTIAVAGRAPEGNDTFGVVHVLHFSSGSTPSRTHVDRSMNGTSFTTVAFSADGSRLVAGDARGQLHVFMGSAAAPALPLPGTAAPVSRVLVSDDGLRLAAVMGQQLVLLDGAVAPPSVVYNATLAGPVVDVAANRTLGVLALAVNGTGLVGFGDASATPTWTIPGLITRVAVSEDGSTIAYASRTTVQAARLPRAISLEHASGGDEAPAQPVRPRGTATFDLQVRNTGAVVERVRFETSRELDLTVSVEPAIAVVEPEATVRLKVTVTTGPLFTGTRSLNLSAVTLATGLRDDAVIALQLQDEPNVRFLLNDTGDIAMKPGETRLVLLGVLNNGSTDAAVGIGATQTVTAGSAWDLTVDPASLTLAPSSVTTVRVSLRAPENALDGTSNTVRFTLEGTNVSDSVALTFRINPTLGVEVNAAGRVKFVEPGATAFYNVTITNTGTLPRRFEAFYEATPQGGKSWAIDMDTSAFRLEPAATRTVQVRIFAPQDATPGTDRVSVLVHARSFPEAENETLAEGNITLFANAIEPKPITTTTPPGRVIPGLAAPVIAFAIVAVAFLHRRRAA